MITVKGVFHRYRRISYAANIELEIEQEVLDGKTYITIDTHGRGFFSQGYIEEVPAVGYDDWKAGTIAGIEYALRVCAAPPCHVVITKIEGLTTDTNPTIVAAAAIDGIWKAFGFHPTDELKTNIEQLVFNSWDVPLTSIPQFS